jgi:diaminohydroxyphosphoribosylaminopyrimidine deaminase/5-amino-6-(5-phosphoribosylamino)uracil reductase
MSDKKFMRRAINLAKRAVNKTFPNPLVGAVVVKNGQIIGEGFHEKFGLPHAEVNAIRNCSINPEGASIYVNLEPCSHYGKTPPCADLIVKSKIKNVFIGMTDPNPLVSGRGIEKLKNSGINVFVGVLEEECKKLNEVFIKLITKKESFLTHKIASTLDGKIAEKTGYSKWITSEKSRNYVHKLRSFANGILVGANTVRNDDPQLNVRKNGEVIAEPYRIIVSKELKFDSGLKIFKNPDKIIIVTSERNYNNPFLENFKTIYLPEENNSLNLKSLNIELYKNNIYHIFAEGGSFLNHSLFKYRLVDKIFIFYSNKFLAGKDSMQIFNGKDLYSLDCPLILNDIQIKKLGSDFCVTGYPEF